VVEQLFALDAVVAEGGALVAVLEEALEVLLAADDLRAQSCLVVQDLAQVHPIKAHLVKQGRGEDHLDLASALRVLRAEAGHGAVDAPGRVAQVAGHEAALQVPELEAVDAEVEALPAPVAVPEELPEQPSSTSSNAVSTVIV